MRRNPAKHPAALAAVLLSLAALGCQTSQEGWPVADDSEWREGGPPVLDAPLPPSGTASAPGLETVYFALDAWSLDARSRSALQQNARQITLHPEWGTIRIEGHCDERGSEEYNLLLGKRRAQEVASYLRDLGVPRARLATVSYGEAQPAVDGASEAAWRWNRRSVFQTVARTASR